MIRELAPQYSQTCESCNTCLTFETEDVSIGEGGLSYIVCPKCGDRVCLCDDAFDLQLTPDNIQYPQRFFNYVGGVNIPDSEVNNWVHEIMDDLKMASNDTFEYGVVSSGNTCVLSIKDDGKYIVFVMKDYECVEFDA